jgi:hypothetical protein
LKKARIPDLTAITSLRQDLHEYWQTLPNITYCRDLAPRGPLFRFNIHLVLTYHLAHLFIGRSFIFTSPGTSSRYPLLNEWESQSAEFRTSLVAESVTSAISIIDLCQTLQDEIGLARASYTEFTTCRAALLVILAQRLGERSNRLRKASEQAMELLKHMALGFYSADAEKSVIEAMETAIRRLDSRIRDERDNKAESSDVAGSAYTRFQHWAMLWRKEASGPWDTINSDSSPVIPRNSTPLDSTNFTNPSSFQDFDWDTYSTPFQFDLGNDFVFTGADFPSWPENLGVD